MDKKENMSLEELIEKFEGNKLDALIAMASGNIAAEIMENYSLERATEYVFSTIIYALIDMWLEKQGRRRASEFADFVRAVMQAGVETLQEEEKEVQG